MTTPGLLVLGNVNVDLVLGEIDGWPAIGTEIMVDRVEMRPGGSAGNTALALAGLGEPHLLVASTGSDANGIWLREQFDGSTSDWIACEGGTTLTVGIVHKGGDRAFLTTPGHLLHAGADELIARVPEAPGGNAWAILSGAFLMPRLMQAGGRLLEQLAEKGWRTAIDPGWPPQGWEAVKHLMRGWLARADCALLNADEARALSGLSDLDEATVAIARMLRGDGLLVVKDGANGASVLHWGAEYRAIAPKVAVVDTVGAGDTFNAAFLAALAHGSPLQAALETGVITAARAISTFPRRYAS